MRGGATRPARGTHARKRARPVQSRENQIPQRFGSFALATSRSSQQFHIALNLASSQPSAAPPSSSAASVSPAATAAPTRTTSASAGSVSVVPVDAVASQVLRSLLSSLQRGNLSQLSGIPVTSSPAVPGTVPTSGELRFSLLLFCCAARVCDPPFYGRSPSRCCS